MSLEYFLESRSVFTLQEAEEFLRSQCPHDRQAFKLYLLNYAHFDQVSQRTTDILRQCLLSLQAMACCFFGLCHGDTIAGNRQVALICKLRFTLYQ